MSTNTKQQIKNRMLKKAASLWGVTPNEIESSFDPLVALLISACASEIEKISGEINNSQTRITERLIQLMTPETIYGAKPAHAIAYTEPVEATTLLKPENLFFYKKKINTRNAGYELKNIYFSPLQETKLVNATIDHVLCGDKLLSFQSKKKKTIKLSIKDHNKIPPSTLYFGVRAENNKISLKDVSLYFELQDVSQTELFYHHLKNAKWFVNGKKVNVSSGFYNGAQVDKLNLESIFNHTPNKTRNITTQVDKLYRKHFITIKSDETINKEATETEISEFISVENHDELQNLNWIKVVFPRIIDNTILQNVYCSFNAFPVLNRKWESISYQLKDYIDIIPVNTQELFLDIKSIVNTSGEIYKLQENDSSRDYKGTFVIRNDNVGKLDVRKAREYILHLIELLKDESASFSFYGSDFLQSNINELNQTISLLEKKVSDFTKPSTETSYISVKPYKKRETLLIDYWTTNGVEANNIKSGSALSIYQGSDLKQKSSMLVTPSFQGKDNLSMEERLHAYRRALLSRNRIVTKEDVKALCYELCGDKVKDVKVVKTFKTSVGVQEGVVPCIEIQLYPNTSTTTIDVEWESLKSNILSILEQQSLNMFPYRIKLFNN